MSYEEFTLKQINSDFLLTIEENKDMIYIDLSDYYIISLNKITGILINMVKPEAINGVQVDK